MDKKWWCADERLCLARVAAARDADLQDIASIYLTRPAAAPAAAPQDIAAMYRALDQVWADLEKNGWRL
jgi:1,4-dihydroxy-2-naphthoyl-CoA synthase